MGRHRFAKKEIKNQVIRADQLVAYIKEMDKSTSDGSFSNEAMLNSAKSFVAKNIPERSDYAKKYETILEQIKEVAAKNTFDEKICPRCGSRLVLQTLLAEL